METKPSAQFHFKKLSFGKGSQKARKSRYQTFLVQFYWTSPYCSKYFGPD